MQLDFSKLNTATTEARQKALERDFIATDNEEHIEAITEPKTATESPRKAPEQIETEEAVKDKMTVISVSNLAEARELQKALEAGISTDTDKLDLFLQAVKVVGLLTGDNTYYERIREKAISVYGEGQLEQIPLEWRLQDIQTALKKMRASLKRKTLKPDTIASITEAIKEHEAKEQELKSLIADASQLTLNIR